MHGKCRKYPPARLSQWPFGLNFLPNYSLNTPRVPMGDWGSEGTHITQFQGFWVRPRGFGGARGQNLSNKAIFDLKIPIFERFLASTTPKTSWSHPEPLISSSVGPSRPPVTHGHPGCVQRLKISRILSVFLSYLAQSTLLLEFFYFYKPSLIHPFVVCNYKTVCFSFFNRRNKFAWRF